MECPNCRADVSELAKFCSQCGSALVLICPSCGNSEAPGSKFCGKCGATLAGSSGACKSRNRAKHAATRVLPNAATSR